MRSGETIENPVLDTAKGLAALSIVIDDFDSAKAPNNKEMKLTQETTQKICSESPACDKEIKKILEEAEHRKHEFWKLLEEYSEVVENIKRIEQLENNSSTIRKVQSPTIST